MLRALSQERERRAMIAQQTAANLHVFKGSEEDFLRVVRNGDAVAFPVRQLAYHHLVEDSVGGVPIVATY